MGVPVDTLLRWEHKFNITVLPHGRVRCVEMNKIFDDKRAAARYLFPHLNPNGCAHNILRAVRTHGTYNGYHWELLEKEVF